MTSPDENATLAKPLLRSCKDLLEQNETFDATATDEDDESDGSTEPESLSETKQKHIRKLLYTSHFLSTWNSRLFEFGAFLFLANIYPQTLLPASLYALCRNASAAIVAPWIGSYIDRTDRLVVVRISIGKNICTISAL
jgi:iron-regulated transporter 1